MGRVGSVSVRWSGLTDGDETVPPGVEGNPIAVGIFVARGSGLADFEVIDGMDLPHCGAHGRALGTTGAGFVGGIEKELAGDPIRVCGEASVEAWVGNVFPNRWIVDLEVADLVP